MHDLVDDMIALGLSPNAQFILKILAALLGQPVEHIMNRRVKLIEFMRMFQGGRHIDKLLGALNAGVQTEIETDTKKVLTKGGDLKQQKTRGLEHTVVTRTQEQLVLLEVVGDLKEYQSVKERLKGKDIKDREVYFRQRREMIRAVNEKYGHGARYYIDLFDNYRGDLDALGSKPNPSLEKLIETTVQLTKKRLNSSFAYKNKNMGDQYVTADCVTLNRTCCCAGGSCLTEGRRATCR